MSILELQKRSSNSSFASMKTIQAVLQWRGDIIRLEPRTLHDKLFCVGALIFALQCDFAHFRVGFWQNVFFADCFRAAAFLRGFRRRIFSRFCGEKVPRKILLEIPDKIFQNLYYKVHDIFLQRGWANTLHHHIEFPRQLILAR